MVMPHGQQTQWQSGLFFLFLFILFSVKLFFFFALNCPTPWPLLLFSMAGSPRVPEQARGEATVSEGPVASTESETGGKK